MKVDASVMGPQGSGDLLGRADDLAQLRALLDESPLVTLVGPGGAGKTSLVRALEATLAASAPEAPVAFVDLTETTSLEAALGALAGALEVPLGAASGARGIAVVAAALASRGDVLLILDNLEQLGLAAAQLVDGLSAEVGGLRVLGTSRAPLGARGERSLELPPLSKEAAQALFIARATEARTTFHLREEDAALLAELLESLDRLPLAIELAAARLEVLTLAELRQHLTRGAEVLARPNREGRHGAMRTVLEGSWRMLDEVEQRAFARLSVFAGGFDLEAAQAVLGRETSALDVVHALKRKSLLQAQAERERGGMRFRLLETIRSFGREKLEAQGDAATAATAHAQHFGERARRWLQSLELPVLFENVENLISAVEQAKDLAPVATARISLALDLVIASRGPLLTRCRYLETGYEAAKAADEPELLARILIAQGEAARAEGQVERALAAIAEAMALIERLGDRLLLGRAKSALGTAYFFQGDAARAEAAYREALEALAGERTNVDRGMVLARLFAMPIARGVFDGGNEPLGREALEIFRRTGERRWETIARMNLAVLYSELGQLDAAEELLLQGLQGVRAAGDRVSATMHLHNLGLIALDRGDLDHAETLLNEALELSRDTGDVRVGGIAAGCLGIVCALAGRQGEAVALLAEGRQLATERKDPSLAALFGAWSASLRGQPVSLPPAEAQTNASFAQAVRILAGHDEAPLGIHPRIAARHRGAQAGEAPQAGLTLLQDGLRFRVEGEEEVDLSRRGALRRLLLAFVDAQTEQPGIPLDVHALLEAGWPGERILPEAGANRVYTAIRHLRGMGMKELLITRDGGYLLDPDCSVARVD